MVRILIADDEDNIREVIKGSLAGQGYEFVEFSDGAAAYTAAHSEQFDIILLDLTMPVMSGLEVLQKLKENPSTREVPVLVLTARHLPKYENKAMSLGASDFITKPFSPEELSDRVRMALAQ